MAARVDPAVLAHLEWLGFVRPTGLVVSAPALVRAGAILDRADIQGQRLLQACAKDREFNPMEGPTAWLPDFRVFANTVLGWSFSPKGYAGSSECPIPAELEVPLLDYDETLRPDFAVREMDPREGQPPWQLLVKVLEPGQEFDRAFRNGGQLEASAHGRMERLLRERRVPAGLLFNGKALRLVSAPRGESSGWLDFKVADMVQTGGRPISTALRLLLSEPRLLSLPTPQRLAALLDNSRKFQNEVSERLAEQVLQALYELLRGFQAAHDGSKGELLREPLAEHPDEIYRALLIVILRLIFLLFAEERDMLPEQETFLRYYSLAGLYERLREDASLFPDTMDQRYGAWAQLLVLFRLIHDGATWGAMHLPKRQSVLFDPERFKFLEGRLSGASAQVNRRVEPPLVPDGTVYRALEKLLVLDGERISYRALDVEQIGSVYETMIGFRLETATGRSVAIKAQKKQGAPTVVDVEALLGEPPSKRATWLQDRADRKLSDRVQQAVAEAETLEDLHAALMPVIDPAATPDLVPKGAMVLQPSVERRRSGSYYTPRELTEPIVRTTLEPILARIRGVDGRPPQPAQILELKVCDPAMGSGAFLVEACRQLGDALVEAWHMQVDVPAIPADEDEVIFARRLIAQRCIYGVDKNPVAVDLAKVSLWLVTLARDHALTFVDHALRHGDSLVGLSRKQIEAFHWDPDAPRFQAAFETMRVRQHIGSVTELRQRIRNADDSVSDWELRDMWDEAQLELAKVRLFGDLVVAAFFHGEKPKEREAKRGEYANALVSGEADLNRGWLEDWRHGDPPLAPLHWEIEFPEVFERENPGFDAIMGNPPFMAGMRISSHFSRPYLDWLYLSAPGAGSRADLVVYFFRRAFNALRSNGCLGLVATNTISQGDTRKGGLYEICRTGGRIYAATKRIPWPGAAAVIVSVVHIQKDGENRPCVLDGASVDRISSYLLKAGSDESPLPLASNLGKCWSGVYPYGAGFLFQDANRDSAPITAMEEILAKDRRYEQFIHPYIGGDEFLNDPRQRHQRYVIDFGNLAEEEARRWPLLMEILETNAKPFRATTKRRVYRERWWLFAEPQLALRRSLAALDRVLMHPFTSSHLAFAFVPSTTLIGQPHLVVVDPRISTFCVLQSRINETWVRFTSSTLKDDLSYKIADSFETFPFPDNWETSPALDASGQTYYEFRGQLMRRNNEGLTKTYNRLNDPNEDDAEIAKLRVLHSAMDRAVLDAYGWSDIRTDCDFFLDYQIDDEEWGTKKKPWRYRWPDEVRDDVLARLLELNAERAKEEARIGATSTEKRRKRTPLKGELTAPKAAGLFE